MTDSRPSRTEPRNLTALALPALAGDSGKEVKLAGWITDEWCGKKGALEHVGHKVVVVGVMKDDA